MIPWPRHNFYFELRAACARKSQKIIDAGINPAAILLPARIQNYWRSVKHAAYNTFLMPRRIKEVTTSKDLYRRYDCLPPDWKKYRGEITKDGQVLWTNISGPPAPPSWPFAVFCGATLFFLCAAALWIIFQQPQSMMYRPPAPAPQQKTYTFVLKHLLLVQRGQDIIAGAWYPEPSVCVGINGIVSCKMAVPFPAYGVIKDVQ